MAVLFCSSCGRKADGSAFCPQCGQPMGNPTTSSPPQSVAAVETPHIPSNVVPTANQNFPSKRRSTLLTVGIAAVILLLLAGFLVIKNLSDGSTKGFEKQAKSTLAPIATANTTLNEDIKNLATSNDSSKVKADATTTLVLVQGAKSTIDGLSPSGSSQSLQSSISTALSDEESWLKAISETLDNNDSPQAGQVQALGDSAAISFKKLSSHTPPVYSDIFPDSKPLIAFFQKVSQQTKTKSDEKAFSDSVSGLLDQSKTSFQQINELFNQLDTVANGGYSDITLATAEQTINQIIANRNALRSSAAALTAPTALAKQVREALVLAFDKSLDDDQAIYSCLTESNNGYVATIYSTCLSSTADEASAARSAKADFRTVYNKLRKHVGQSPTNRSF